MNLFQAIGGALLGSASSVSKLSCLSLVFGGEAVLSSGEVGDNSGQGGLEPTGLVGKLPGIPRKAHGRARQGHGKPLEKQMLLRRYDAAFAEVLTIQGTESRSRALDRLRPILYELSPDIKAWSGDARLRAYLLMQAIAKDIENPSYTSASMSLLVLILSRGGPCAVEMAKPIFEEKIRAMYKDSRYEKERFLPRLLMELSDYDPKQVEGLAKDAIHLWSDEQFAAASGYLGFDELRAECLRNRLKGVLGAEIAQAGTARDTSALNRAVDLYHEVR